MIRKAYGASHCRAKTARSLPCLCICNSTAKAPCLAKSQCSQRWGLDAFRDAFISYSLPLSLTPTFPLIGCNVYDFSLLRSSGSVSPVHRKLMLPSDDLMSRSNTTRQSMCFASFRFSTLILSIGGENRQENIRGHRMKRLGELLHDHPIHESHTHFLALHPIIRHNTAWLYR